MTVVPRLERYLAALPSVAFKVVQLAILDLATLGWGVDLSHHPDPTQANAVFSSWLLFLAGLHGINLGAFVTAVKSPSTTPGGQSIPPTPTAPAPVPPASGGVLG